MLNYKNSVSIVYFLTSIIYYIILIKTREKLTLKKKISIFLVFFHYTRRSLESVFMHISVKNLDFLSLLGLCIYYWFIFAYLISYELS